MKRPVFQDATGKRWKIIKIVFFISLFILVIFFSLFLLSLGKLLTITSISIVASFILKYEMLISVVNTIGNSIFSILAITLKSYLIFALVIGILRMAILIIFSYKQWKRQKKSRTIKKKSWVILKSQKFRRYRLRPTISVVIPVYNEEVVIEKTVSAVLHSQYPITEVIVVDDGSTDQTAATVENSFPRNPRVKVIRKQNGGKASALNLGFREALGDIIITIDADTVFTNLAISHLVEHFKNPEVAAVSGNCKVGNIRNQLTLWQHIEYVTAFNIERRAYDYLNCITVVPGSNSAWRRKVVQEVGYYDHDTLAEDTDLTLKIVEKGYRITYDDKALSYEECPETVKDFVKQRYRWSYGILQSSWKHRKTILKSKNKTLKFFAVPSLLFSYLLYLTAPLIDIIFIVSLLTGEKTIFLFAIFFYFSDAFASVYAFKLEKESMKPLVWVIIQRFAYRYLIAYVTWKAVIMALKGYSVGWNKFKRTGNNNFN